MKPLVFSLLFFTLLSCSKTDSNVPVENVFEGKLVWSKSYGGSAEDKVSSVVKTPDGGCLVLSNTDSNDGDVLKTHAMTDIWLTKYDASGNLSWSKTIGGSLNDYGTSIINTTDGNYVLAGYSASYDGDVPKNAGLHDFFVSKIDNAGNTIWSKNYGFLGHDHAHKIIQTRDGGFFVAGFAEYDGIIGVVGTGTGTGGDHGAGHTLRNANNRNEKHGVGEFLGIKLDANGNFKWFRYYGGTQNDRVNDIVEADDGGLLMVGFSESSDFDITDNKGSYDFWVIKLEQDGHLHWKENYGGTGIDQAFSITKTNNNSYLIAGRTNSQDGQVSKNLGNFDAWVIHINDHGHLLWEKSFGTPEFDSAAMIKKIANGNFVVAGNTRGIVNENKTKGENDYWIFGIDNLPNSSMLWQKTYGGQKIDTAIDFTEVKPNEFVIVGESQSSTLDVSNNRGFNDLWMIKVQ
jgi:hypothetical protein